MGMLMKANEAIRKVFDDRILQSVGRKKGSLARGLGLVTSSADDVEKSFINFRATGASARDVRSAVMDREITDMDRFKSIFMHNNGSYSATRIAGTTAAVGGIGYEMLADDTSIAGLGVSAGIAGGAGYGIAKFLL